MIGSGSRNAVCVTHLNDSFSRSDYSSTGWIEILDGVPSPSGYAGDQYIIQAAGINMVVLAHSFGRCPLEYTIGTSVLDVLCSLFDSSAVKHDIGDSPHHAPYVLVLEDVPSYGYSMSSGL